MLLYIGRLIVASPNSVLAAFIALTAFLAAGINPEMRPVLENNLPGDDPQTIQYDAVKSVFSDTDSAALVLICNGKDRVFSPECLEKIRTDVTQGAEASEILAPEAVVFSLTDYDYIEAGEDDWIHVDDLVKEIPKSREEIAALKEKVMGDHLLRGRLVSEDGQAALVAFRLSDDATQNAVYDGLLALTRHFEDKPKYVAGAFADDLQNRKFEVAAQDEFVVCGTAAFLLILAFMTGVLGPWAALCVLLAIVVANVWSLGILGWLGYRQNVLTSSLPVVLIAVVSSPGYHMMDELQKAWREEQNVPAAVLRAFRNVVSAVFGGGVTSAFGFLSLIAIPVYSLAEFGLFATAGVLAGMAASICLLPVLVLTLIPRAVTTPQGRSSRIIRARVTYLLDQCELVIRNTSYARAVVVASGILLVVAAIGASRVEVGSEPAHFIPKGDDVRKGFDLLEEYFGGTAIGPVMIDCGEQGAAHDPACLHVADELVTYAETLPDVGFATSLADRVKRLHRVMQGGAIEQERIPETKEAVEQLLLFDNADVIREFQDADERYLQVKLFFYAYDSVRIEALLEKLRRWEKNGTLSYKIVYGGEFFLWARMIEIIGEKGLRSPIILAVFLIIFCGLFFRSLTLGVLSLFPVGTAALLVLGLMGVAGIRLDIANVTVTVITGAMTVDFYIHYMNRTRLFVRRTGDVKKAAQLALKESGVPIVFDCASNLSFGALMISQFIPIRNLGWLLCVAMVAAALMTLVVVPAVLAVFANSFFKRERQLWKAYHEA